MCFLNLDIKENGEKEIKQNENLMLIVIVLLSFVSLMIGFGLVWKNHQNKINLLNATA